MKTLALLIAVAVAFAGTTGCDSHSAAGKAKPTLSIIQPLDELIAPGDRGEVDIRVNRDDFDGAVTIDVSGLPAGIHLENVGGLVIARDQSKVTLNLRADATAPAVDNHVVSVRASAPNVATATESFKISVKK